MSARKNLEQRHRRRRLAKRRLLAALCGPATNPFWQNRHEPHDYEALAASMRSIYNQCSVGSRLPTHAVVVGALINQALGVDAYEPNRAYFVSPNGIVPLDTSDS